MAAAGEEAESSAAGERRRVPFARGGPVFVPFMVGPISTVPEFMSSALSELQSLQDELGDTGDEFDDELSVDELRVLSGRQWRRAGTLALRHNQRIKGLMEECQQVLPLEMGLSPQAHQLKERVPDHLSRVWQLYCMNHKAATEKQGVEGPEAGREKNGTLTSDSSVEREIPGSPVDMAIVPHEPQGSKGKTRDGKGKPRSRKGKKWNRQFKFIN